MDSVEVSTLVYLPPDEVFEFLRSFEKYAQYSKYLRDVRVDGDGGVGTRYAITFAWWKLSYTAHSEVTAVERPRRIDWELVKDVDAAGQWLVEPADDDAPPDVDGASRVRLVVTYRPETAETGVLDLPRFVSLGWVVEKVKPKIREEAERVVERIVADLEGNSRPVDLDIETGTASR